MSDRFDRNQRWYRIPLPTAKLLTVLDVLLHSNQRGVAAILHQVDVRCDRSTEWGFAHPEKPGFWEFR